MSLKVQESKSERLVARINSDDKELIERAAEMEGRSVTAFAIEHLLAKAREVIEERTVVQLNDENYHRFVDALNAPAREPSPEVQEALKLYRENVIEH